MVFRDEIFSTQRLKISFVIPSLVETKLSIVNGLSTLVELLIGWGVSELGILFWVHPSVFLCS